MKLKKILALLAASVLTLGMFAGCGEEAKETGAAGGDSSKPLSGKHYVIALSASFKNFESVTVDEEGNETYEGLDIDFIEQLSKDLGFTYEISNMQFSGLIGALQSGRADMVISGMTATDERRKNVDFSIGYIQARDAFLVKKGSGITTVDDLTGKKIGCSTGTSYEDMARRVPNAQVSTFDGQPAVLQELLNGRIDAMCTDGSLIDGFMKQYDEIDGFMVPVDSSLSEGVAKEFAIAFPKDSELKKVFDEEIQTLKDNGTMDQIIVKWLGEAYIGE